MQTLIFEGVVTALSSVSHNGGQVFGNSAPFRREKFKLRTGETVLMPVVSGNSIRGVLRDRGMLHMCRLLGYGVEEEGFQETAERVAVASEEGERIRLDAAESHAVRRSGLSLPAFHFLFSGGALTSEGGKAINIEKALRIRRVLPLAGVFGGATGNMILPGKLICHKMIPICEETLHLLPRRFHPAWCVLHQHVAPHCGCTPQATTQSIWEYLQTETYTRRDDAKNPHRHALLQAQARPQIAGPQPTLLPTDVEPPDDDPPGSGQKQQMIYEIETLCAGTDLHWKILLDDVWAIEFESFATALREFSRRPYIGGKSGIGHGEVSVHLDRWMSIDSRVQVDSTDVAFPLGTAYAQHIQRHGAVMREELARMI